MFRLTVLGTSSATPTIDRHPSAQALQFGNRLFLIDCGEAAQVQCMKYGVKFFRTESVFISHLHQDHYLGLMGMITSMNLNGRTGVLHIYSPQGLKDIMDVQLKWSGTVMNYELVYHVLNPAEDSLIFCDDFFEVRAYPVQHRIQCFGFSYHEKTPWKKMKKEALEQQDIPAEAFRFLKSGEDFITESGEKLSSHELTETPVLSSYAYITDTLFLPQLAEKLKGIHTLYHEATYLDELLEKALTTFHSTAKQAGEFADICQPTQLILGHFSSRYADTGLLAEEASKYFLQTHSAKEGEVFII